MGGLDVQLESQHTVEWKYLYRNRHGCNHALVLTIKRLASLRWSRMVTITMATNETTIIPMVSTPRTINAVFHGAHFRYGEWVVHPHGFWHSVLEEDDWDVVAP